MTAAELSLRETSRLLGVPEEAVRRWARKGSLPSRVDGEDFLFLRSEVEAWARRLGMKLRDPRTPSEDSGTRKSADLGEALRRGGLLRDIEGESLREVYANMVAKMDLPGSLSPETLLDRLLQREELATTGIGNGIAIPHPRHPLQGLLPAARVTVVQLAHPIDFKAVDGLPVDLLLVCLSTSLKEHLGLLKECAHLLQKPGASRTLHEATSIDEVLALL